MLYTEIKSPEQLRTLFERCGREESFSREGFMHLFEYLLEVSTDAPIEIDPIGICCEFSENDESERDDYDSESILAEWEGDDGKCYLVHDC